MNFEQSHATKKVTTRINEGKRDDDLLSKCVDFKYFIRDFKSFSNYIEIEVNLCNEICYISENINGVKFENY